MLRTLLRKWPRLHGPARLHFLALRTNQNFQLDGTARQATHRFRRAMFSKLVPMRRYLVPMIAREFAEVSTASLSGQRRNDGLVSNPPVPGRGREGPESAHLRHCLTRGEGRLTDSRAAARRRQRDRRHPARRCKLLSQALRVIAAAAHDTAVQIHRACRVGQ